ncbi:MAG: TonB-dependent receptor [Thermoanaerobaculia bacterium]
MRTRPFLLVAAVTLLSAQTTLAQTTGTIRGEVTDSAGGTLPGVTVTVSGERGVERVVTTGPNGTFLVTSVPPGTYGLEATLEGMGTQSASGVRVSIGGDATVNFVLGGDSFAEEMTVTAETPLLDLTSSEVGSNYSAEFTEDLPTRRNFWDIVSVSPGMSQSDEGNDRQSAFGSNIQSNSWNVDGMDVSGSETGAAWWYVNPDTIEEVQVLGIGAPAEFGNMTGAAINVVTKSGTNEYKGNLNVYYQSDALTDTGAKLEGSEFPTYTRDKYHDATLSFGGPFKRDKAWFFGAVENTRDAFAVPGVDPDFAPETSYDRYDAKLDFSLSPRAQLDVKYHYEDYDLPEAGSAFIAPSAAGVEFGTNPAWGGSFSYTLSDRTLVEAHYAGWDGDDFWRSQTGSTEPPYIDFSPAGGGPPVYTGGTPYPFDYFTSRDQADVKLSHYAEDFLHGDHDFRFGVQYSAGTADTVIFAGFGGGYYYRYEYDYYGYLYPYYYLYTFTPFHYGADNSSVSAFMDDSWRVNDRLTLNVGVRWDQHDGKIPAYPRLNSAGAATGETIPGIDNVIDWNTISPRLGFAWVATDDARTVVRGSYGIYYDGNVTGNWDYPPPQAPAFQYFLCNGPPPTTCDADPFFEQIVPDLAVDPDLDPPKSTQWALGLERQLRDTMALGVQLVYKETEDLVGWEILDDGILETVVRPDPITGEPVTLLDFCEEGCVFPTIRKGNRPGAGSLLPDEKYHMDYRAAILTFEKRHSNGWSMMGSYTWSKSEGLIPRPLAQTQFNPFYGSTEGADPNQWMNADQLLQGDREHMLRVQANVDLPWTLDFTASLNWQTGRPYSRQARFSLGQGLTTVILDPASDSRRLPDTTVLDVGIGKRFEIGRSEIKLDFQVLNLLNEDANQFWETLVLGPGDRFVPSDFVYPRRGILRLGVSF